MPCVTDTRPVRYACTKGTVLRPHDQDFACRNSQEMMVGLRVVIMQPTRSEVQLKFAVRITLHYVSHLVVRRRSIAVVCVQTPYVLSWTYVPVDVHVSRKESELWFKVVDVIHVYSEICLTAEAPALCIGGDNL